MADISKELAAIMAAVFGKDVRKSIHDAIQKINEASEKQLDIGTAVTSTSSPSADYMGGSLYINSDTYELWKCIGENSWQSMGILKGVDGRAIVAITGPVTVGNIDTYTIEYSDNTDSTFTVTNGIDGIDGNQWYRGTALTGTGTGITGYPGKLRDFYLNPTTGYVYQCSRAGDVTTAEWDYAMAITGGTGGSVVVIDNLSNTSTTDALSANQGRNLNNKKIEKPANPSEGQILGFDGTDWVAIPKPEGHQMLPNPDSQEPQTAAAREAAIVQAVKDGVLDGWDNKNVASLNTIGTWSNTAKKTFIVQGIAGASTPIGTTGIGRWFDGDLEDIDPTTDEADWIGINELSGINSSDDVRVGLLYDPDTTAGIALGGYIIDDTTCKMCIKFANEISEDDTHTAKVGIELTVQRTAPTAVSFS